jgi:hypothetical protein
MNAGLVLLQAPVGLASLGIAVMVRADTAGAYLRMISPGIPLHVAARHVNSSTEAGASFPRSRAVLARSHIICVAGCTLPTLMFSDVPEKSIFHTYLDTADRFGHISGCADD